MLQPQSIVKIFDNSGAKTAICIKVLKKKKAKIGDFIVISIVDVKPFQKKTNRIKKGDVYLAIVISLKKINQKTSGTTVYTTENSVCLVNKQKKLIATRVYRPIPRELKKKKCLR